VNTIKPPSWIAVREVVLIAIGSTIHVAQACAALESGVYQTPPGATVEERGDRVPNERRVIPFSAAVSFDLTADPPALTTLITNAVIEGGEPFALVVHSTSGERLIDGTYLFSGDYLLDVVPTGTQYLFDWRFSTSSEGKVAWNGVTGWAGGHIWQVTISDITMVPQAWLNISLAASASAQLTWSTNFIDYVLECTTNLPAADWSTVTNAIESAGDHLSVTVDVSASKQFYRLRKP
jgi:hypothetical protein